MKHVTRYTQLHKALLLSLFALCGMGLFAQQDSAAQPAATETTPGTDTAAADTETAPSLISPSIEFTCVQKGEQGIHLSAKMKAKVKNSFINLRLLKVSFVQVTDTGEHILGFAITDKVGLARFICKPGTIVPGKDGKYNFKAVFAGNKAMEPAEEETTAQEALLEMVPVKEEGQMSVQLKLTGGGKPVAGVVVGLFVNRLFRPLKIGEGTTDENGEAIVEVPARLPGDAKGNLTLLAKLDEHELYGNLESSVVQKWGIPVSDKIEDQPRALWSQHPPLWMLITFIVLMVTVWGHYLFIVKELFRLRKEQPPVQAS